MSARRGWGLAGILRAARGEDVSAADGHGVVDEGAELVEIGRAELAALVAAVDRLTAVETDAAAMRAELHRQRDEHWEIVDAANATVSWCGGCVIGRHHVSSEPVREMWPCRRVTRISTALGVAVPPSMAQQRRAAWDARRAERARVALNQRGVRIPAQAGAGVDQATVVEAAS